MSRRVEFSPLAQKEMERSYDWYEEQSVGLGRRFANEIYASVTKILKNPKAYPKKIGNRRELRLDIFPFVIVYRYIETSDSLIIQRVFHNKRNPVNKYRGK